jgi:hypothetical protein
MSILGLCSQSGLAGFFTTNSDPELKRQIALLPLSEQTALPRVN